MVTGQSPTAAFRSDSVRSMRWGASKNTMVPRIWRRRSNQPFRSFDRVGGNPRNVKESNCIPEAVKAAMMAQGPGRGSTRMPAATAAAMSCAPGSEIVGVPASDTRATLSPAKRRATSEDAFFRSLWAWRLVVGVAIACRASRCAVRRVSSAAMIATSRRIRSARIVMSSRFPIGVATTKSVPAVLVERLKSRFVYCTIGGSFVLDRGSSADAGDR